MDIEKGTKVKLTVDLTQYAKGLVAGTEGITAGQQGMWSRGSDRFVTVRFPGITTLDVLWDSLEIIDEEVLKEMDRQKKLFVENLKSAKDVTLYVGPRGVLNISPIAILTRSPGSTFIHRREVGIRHTKFWIY